MAIRPSARYSGVGSLLSAIFVVGSAVAVVVAVDVARSLLAAIITILLASSLTDAAIDTGRDRFMIVGITNALDTVTKLRLITRTNAMNTKLFDDLLLLMDDDDV
jgi:hypothetical protein